MRHHKLGASLCRVLGEVIGRLALNDVRLCERKGESRALKRRRWYAHALILGGNVYIRLARVRVRVLPERPWLAREALLYRELYGETIDLGDDGWLNVPRRGEALSLYLRRPEVCRESARRALMSAASELFRLHGITVRDGSEIRLFSHGDAGARNVAYDAGNGRAHWFDFEMIHLPGLDRAWRQADDLRALFFSALASIPAHDRDEAIAVMLAVYPDPTVLAMLHDRLADSRLDFDTYHLAQSRLAGIEHQAIRLSLLQHLEEILAEPPRGATPRRNPNP